MQCYICFFSIFKSINFICKDNSNNNKNNKVVTDVGPQELQTKFRFLRCQKCRKE